MTTQVLAQYCFIICLTSLSLICGAAGDLKPRKESDKSSTSLQLPPCEACEMVYKSFMDAMKQTAQNHFGGGDTSWEEAKLGPYATSEVRLIEIQELLCKHKRAQDQCHRLVEEWEQDLEDWWFKYRTETPDLYEYLCINSQKLCCPSGHYGLYCKPCPGFPTGVCNNNGKCKGNGTRTGNGECICNNCYEGKLCDNCAVDCYKELVDNKLNCKKCDISCEGGCTSFGPQNCKNCAEGWTMQTGNGCVDVDECSQISGICKEHEFCINTPGSFKCVKCDNACEGCSGPGPEHCIKCSNDYIQDGDLCVKFHPIKSHSNITRYLTYLGLCVGTLILFRNRPLVASIVGLGVAFSVTLTEYMHGNTLAYETLSIFNSIKRW